MHKNQVINLLVNITLRIMMITLWKGDSKPLILCKFSAKGATDSHAGKHKQLTVTALEGGNPRLFHQPITNQT